LHNFISQYTRVFQNEELLIQRLSKHILMNK